MQLFRSSLVQSHSLSLERDKATTETLKLSVLTDLREVSYNIIVYNYIHVLCVRT